MARLTPRARNRSTPQNPHHPTFGIEGSGAGQGMDN